jgi:hypothetical protein
MCASGRARENPVEIVYGLGQGVQEVYTHPIRCWKAARCCCAYACHSQPVVFALLEKSQTAVISCPQVVKRAYSRRKSPKLLAGGGVIAEARGAVIRLCSMTHNTAMANAAAARQHCQWQLAAEQSATRQTAVRNGV